MQALVLGPKESMTTNLYPTSDSLLTQGSCRVAAESPTASIQPPVRQTLQVITQDLPTAHNTERKGASLNWILGLSVVKFDIDQGNVVEAIYPTDVLTKPEQKTLSLLSFPDSNAFSAEGTLKYVFRFKRDLAQNDGSFASLFGYVHFIQKKDPSNPRGFSQKSIVILSALPFCEFFKNILDILFKSYEEQEDIIEPEQYLKENFNTIINEWPRPQPGFQHELYLHGNKLGVSVPKNIYESKHIDTQQNTKVDKLSPSDKSSSNEDSPAKEGFSSRGDLDDDENKEKTEKDDQSLSKILCGFSLQEKGSFQDINLYKIFKGDKLPFLWKLWELVLTNQPIMIVSDLPSECSEAVMGLLSVIYPLEYQTDYKPYFTIYDPEYREIQGLYDKKMAKCAVLGVTNPLFLKTMPGYPNIFHLEADFLKQKNNKSSKKPSFLESTQKLYTLPDSSLKKMLMQIESEEADAINNALLRKSLQRLTESFLSVFQLYFKLQINDIKKFEEKDFMKFLELQKFPFKSQFSSQAHILKLYAKFLKSANFQHYIKTFSNVYLVKNV